MRQLVQSVRNGKLEILECPTPVVGPTEVLVDTSFSLLSSGTESSLRSLASSSLIAKARKRPDLVKQVLRRAADQGVLATMRTVNDRLDESMPLGYSGSGVVIAAGEYVSRVKPGMRVATGSAGHGDMQLVPGQLCVPIPDGVSLEDASFATLASIALHGLRLTEVGVGGSICVVGLGLIGQLTARIALASGMRVFGVDLKQDLINRAASSGIEAAIDAGHATTEKIVEWSRHRGVDAVIVTAGTPSSEPVLRAPSRLRDRGTIVVVGDVGLSLERTPLYSGEHTLRVARSYGPGRYERSYEEWGVDLPVGYVPFTEGRNLEVILDLMGSGRLRVDDLVSHQFDFESALDAYDLLSSQEPSLGIQLVYHPADTSSDVLAPTQAREQVRIPDKAELGVGLIGAGTFARSTLIPAIRAANLGRIVAVSSARGMQASRLASKVAARAMSPSEILQSQQVDLVVIASSHGSHSDAIVAALKAGKHVYCEKPPVISREELARVRETMASSEGKVFVGFNRRFARDVMAVKSILEPLGGPLNVVYRINAGRLPVDHWYHDRIQGGRLVGECCHFIDACNFLAGGVPTSVMATSSGSGELHQADDLGILLTYADGSIASILYSSRGHGGMGKELIEVFKGGVSASIKDFRGVTLNGRSRKRRQDKGFEREFRHVSDSLHNVRPTSDDWETTMETVFRVLDVLAGA